MVNRIVFDSIVHFVISLLLSAAQPIQLKICRTNNRLMCKADKHCNIHGIAL